MKSERCEGRERRKQDENQAKALINECVIKWNLYLSVRFCIAPSSIYGWDLKRITPADKLPAIVMTTLSTAFNRLEEKENEFSEEERKDSKTTNFLLLFILSEIRAKISTRKDV